MWHKKLSLFHNALPIAICMHGLLVVLTRLKTNKEKRTSGIKKAVVGRISGVVALTGCFYKKMYGRFAGSKKSGRNNEVVVWRGSTVAPKISPKYLTCDHTVEFKEKEEDNFIKKSELRIYDSKPKPWLFLRCS